MLLIALPAELIFEEMNLITSASRAGDAVRPSASHEILYAVLRIGEVNDCFLKCLGLVGACHDSSMPQIAGLVKYIISVLPPGRSDGKALKVNGKFMCRKCHRLAFVQHFTPSTHVSHQDLTILYRPTIRAQVTWTSVKPPIMIQEEFCEIPKGL